MTYPQIIDGDTIIPKGSPQKLRMSCCDCDLVHDFTFTVVEGVVVLTVFRNNRATSQIRRHTRREVIERDG